MQATENTLILPNPANGQFSIIDIPEYIDKIEILNISGRIIYTEDISDNTYSGNTKSNQLAPGVYFIHLKGKGKNIIKKLVVY